MMMQTIHKQIQYHKKEREKMDLGYVLGDLQPPTFHSVLASVEGPKGTPYEGGLFTFQICFVEKEYKPFKVYPIDVLPHPCINLDKVGLDILDKKSYANKTSILCLMDMLTLLIKRPEMGYSVDPIDLDMYLNDPEGFNEKIREAVIEQNAR